MYTTAHKQAFVTLINQNKGIIYKVCNAYCSNPEDREDLAQEIIYNLWKSFYRFDSQARFSTWMYRIALNVAISFYRKEIRSAPNVPFEEAIVVFEDDAALGNDAEDNMSMLFRLIGELKEIDRSIILLYLEDKSYKEIADITGITESNVATRLNRAKEKLKSSFLTNQK